MHWVPNLQEAEDAYGRAGLRLHPTPFAPVPGTHSATWWDGRRYVEVLALPDRGKALSRTSIYGALPDAVMPHVDAVLTEGGGATNFVVAVDDVNQLLKTMHNAGTGTNTTSVTMGRKPRAITLTFVWPTTGPAWKPIFVHYSLPEWMRRFAERLKRGAPPQQTLSGLVVEVPNPADSARWLASVLDIPSQGWRMEIGGRSISFHKGPTGRITAVRLEGRDVTPFEDAGLRFEREDRK
ncbi:hypothetical protein AN216_01900 [Streptomyces oceani]|uniref:Glyoxalase-like domain-containing protein n=2 Tax=Streptomyces oceani TaxID=1075402 RepID=A0A1E7KPC5_9ACTN|nr:hypothetical protein AN216_01900 [Streptomyces oceani]